MSVIGKFINLITADKSYFDFYRNCTCRRDGSPLATFVVYKACQPQRR